MQQPTPHAARRSRRRPDLAVDGERGAALAVIAVWISVSVGFTVAISVLGRVMAERRALQSVADGMALTGAHLLQNVPGPLNAEAMMAIAQRNLSFPVTPLYNVSRDTTNHTVSIQVDLVGQIQAGGAWLPEPLVRSWFPAGIPRITANARAQFNEVEVFEDWPAVVLVIDSSSSMSLQVAGDDTRSTFEVLKQLVVAYVGATLPVRNGLVIFNEGVRRTVEVSAEHANNVAAVQEAMDSVSPGGSTNTKEALNRARELLSGVQGGRNIILMTDGDPTDGGGILGSFICWPWDWDCHYRAARESGRNVRQMPPNGAALFAVETAREGAPADASRLLQQIGGWAMSEGSDPSMYFRLTNYADIAGFIRALTRAICAFGPLTAGPNPADLEGPNPKVTVAIKDSTGAEILLPKIEDRNTVPDTTPGYQYVITAEGARVLLTLKSCGELGADPARRLMVRWNSPHIVAPQLVTAP